MLKTYTISFDPNPELLPTIEIISTSEIHQPNDSADDDMILKPPLEMPLLKLPRQQLGPPKQRNRFVRSSHAQMLTEQHTNISRKKEPNIPSSQNARGKIWPCFHRQQSPKEVFQRPHS